jgi:hypothetical protein
MTDEESNEIDKLLDQIREKLKLPTQTNLDDTTTWTTGDSMNYKDSMIDTSHWMINPTTYNYVPTPTITPLTTSHITNMGIGTTGSAASWATTNNFNFDINKYQNKEFETHMPGLHKINQMCEMFPAFKKAYDHMRTIYDLVHDEYLERKKEQ